MDIKQECKMCWRVDSEQGEEIFPDFQSAQDAMVKDLAEQLSRRIDITGEELKKHLSKGTLKEINGYEEDFDVFESSAWFNGNHNEKYEWEIEMPMQMRCLRPVQA